jgi:fatty acid desaturase
MERDIPTSDGATAMAHSASPINDPELLRRVNALRRMDNWTNWFYLAREYLFLSVVVAGGLAWLHFRYLGALSWIWDLPLGVPILTVIGMGQHRLVMLGHEASHYILFRNRWLNELAGDWLCFFPILSTTHNYRLQHLAHHQYVNDPERDPDLIFMEASGHPFHFPVAPQVLRWRELAQQFLWLPGLVRYIRIRAQAASAGTGTGPYQVHGPQSKVLVRVGTLYVLLLIFVMTGLTTLGNARLLGIVPGAMLTVILSFYGLAPERLYRRSLVKPILPPRWSSLMRMTYLTLLITGMAWLSYLTGEPWGIYALILWAVPLLTTFAFFMIVREEIQHGEAGRQPLTHTRIFHGNPLVRFAVFPMGMDYHLPHHLFPMVPHFRLRALHDLLLEAEVYSRGAPIVHGCLFDTASPSRLPATVQ